MDIEKSKAAFVAILSETPRGMELVESSNLIRLGSTNPITDKNGIFLQLDGYFDSDDLLELKRALDEVAKPAI